MQETSGPPLLSYSDSYVKLIREGFEQILSDVSFGPEEYEGLTDIEFPDRGTLRIYLKNMYDYLFSDASEQSMPPGC
ncbi:hypothetical protein ACH4TM_05530 [Streptomyces parvus]